MFKKFPSFFVSIIKNNLFKDFINHFIQMIYLYFFCFVYAVVRNMRSSDFSCRALIGQISGLGSRELWRDVISRDDTVRRTSTRNIAQPNIEVCSRILGENGQGPKTGEKAIGRKYCCCPCLPVKLLFYGSSLQVDSCR